MNEGWCEIKSRAKLKIESRENKILILGKVLGEGQINKKISIIALNFSKSAIEKLKEKKCEIKTIFEELITNPKLKNIKIIKWIK